MSGPRVVVTPEGIRDADPGTCESVCARRGAAVLAYCEALCAPGMATIAAAEAFARFRAAVIATPDSAGVDPDALLMSATRHAAAARAPRQRAMSARVARSLGSGRRAPQACDLAPELLAARAEALLSDADRVRLSRHLQRCAFCRTAQERFGAAEAAYRNPPPDPVPPAAHEAIMRALLAPRSAREHVVHVPGAPADAPRGPTIAHDEDLIGDAVESEEAEPREIAPDDEDPFAAAMADVTAAMPAGAAEAPPAPWVDDGNPPWQGAGDPIDCVIAVHGRSARPGSVAVASPTAPRASLSRHAQRSNGRHDVDADEDVEHTSHHGGQTGTIAGAPLSPLSEARRRRPLWALVLPLAVVAVAVAIVLAVSGVFGAHASSPPNPAPAPPVHHAATRTPAPAAAPGTAHVTHHHHHHHSTAPTIGLPAGSGGAPAATGAASATPSGDSAPTTATNAPAATPTPASSAPPGAGSGGSAPATSTPAGGGTAGGTGSSPTNASSGGSVDGGGSPSSAAPPSGGGTPASGTPAGTYQPGG